jgi:hypothetical protein
LTRALLSFTQVGHISVYDSSARSNSSLGTGTTLGRNLTQRAERYATRKPIGRDPAVATAADRWFLGNGFGLISPFPAALHLPPSATSCNHGAP